MGEPSGVIVVPLGYNPSARLRAFELDASDRLRVSVDVIPSPLSSFTFDVNSHLLVAFSAPSKGLVGMHGAVGGNWQKQPIIPGYSDTVREVLSSTTLAAGTNTFNGTTVPAGEVWEIENFDYLYIGTVATVALTINIISGAIEYSLFAQAPPVSNVHYDKQTRLTLKPGENLRFRVFNATLNDDAYFYYVGRKFSINL